MSSSTRRRLLVRLAGLAAVTLLLRDALFKDPPPPSTEQLHRTEYPLSPPPPPPPPPPSPLRGSRAASTAATVRSWLWWPAAPLPSPRGCTTNPFVSLGYVNVETRLSKSWEGFCKGLWKPLAAAGMHLLFLGDRPTILEDKRGDDFVASMKLHTVYKFIAQYGPALSDPDHTLLVHSDASDSLFYGTAEGLQQCVAATFCEHGWDPAVDVLISGERNLVPHSPHYNLSVYNTSGDYRFVNSGTFGGSFTALGELLEDAIALDREHPNLNREDQAIMHTLLLWHPRWSKHLHLDQTHRCFASAYMHNGEYSMEGGRWRHTKHGTTPSILHFNSGAAKRDEMPKLLDLTPAKALPWGDAKLAGGMLTKVGLTAGTSVTVPLAQQCGGKNS